MYLRLISTWISNYVIVVTAVKLTPCANPDSVIPPLSTTDPVELGTIGVIGGSSDYYSACYFTAISALKIGADTVHVITTENTAQVIQIYSPNLIVYPYLHQTPKKKIEDVIKKMDILIIGPGLGSYLKTSNLILDLIQACRKFKKPLIIDGDGLFIIANNLTLLRNYPNGVILTPDKVQMTLLNEEVPSNVPVYDYLGENISVLLQSRLKEDKFLSNDSSLNFFSRRTSPGRRLSGENNILAGALATLYNWSLKAKRCQMPMPAAFAASGATWVALKLLDACNGVAFHAMGRGMVATDIIDILPNCFRNFFNDYPKQQ